MVPNVTEETLGGSVNFWEITKWTVIIEFGASLHQIVKGPFTIPK